MRIPDRTRTEEGERLTLVPESVDDLWHLSHVVEPADLVRGETTRRVRQDDEERRDTGGRREPMSVTIDVETVEFDRFANRLRIGGEIVSASREDEVGHHHTLNVKPRSEITVEKRLKPDQRERLQAAVEGGDRPAVVIATVEEGRATVHTVEEHGTEELATVTGSSGKGEYTASREELFADLVVILERHDPDAIILAGPGFTKQDARVYLDEHAPELTDRVTVVDTSAAGDRGVHEVLSRGAVDDVREETRIAREAELIDEFTERLADGVKVAYGPEAVATAAEMGAVEHLLVVDDALRRERAGTGEWPVDADDVVETVEQQGGEVTVFSSEFEPGQRLRNLGGIAALLRYRID